MVRRSRKLMLAVSCHQRLMVVVERARVEGRIGVFRQTFAVDLMF